MSALVSAALRKATRWAERNFKCFKIGKPERSNRQREPINSEFAALPSQAQLRQQLKEAEAAADKMRKAAAHWRRQFDKAKGAVVRAEARASCSLWPRTRTAPAHAWFCVRA
eukprot:2658293-Pleurochrysis_carterae.AAC.2